MCLLVRSQILGLFVNTMAADSKYSCQYTKNLNYSNAIIQKKKISNFFIAFLKST